jgi:hypothetical protein
VRRPLDVHSAYRASLHRAAIMRTISESDRRSAALLWRSLPNRSGWPAGWSVVAEWPHPPVLGVLCPARRSTVLGSATRWRWWFCYVVAPVALTATGCHTRPVTAAPVPDGCRAVREGAERSRSRGCARPSPAQWPDRAPSTSRSSPSGWGAQECQDGEYPPMRSGVRVEAEFAEDLRGVGLDRPLGNRQAPGDGGVR